MKHHFLKLNDSVFHRVADGQKTFEIRKNDRDYQVGDQLVMNRFEPATNMIHSEVVYAEIVYFSTAYQQDGYCVLGIKVRQP